MLNLGRYETSTNCSFKKLGKVLILFRQPAAMFELKLNGFEFVLEDVYVLSKLADGIQGLIDEE